MSRRPRAMSKPARDLNHLPLPGKTMPHDLHIQRVGQIEDADIRFGDLTVLVGPQATGKSILLQFHKLLVDSGAVLAEMKRYGLDWGKSQSQFLDIYFGEGMRSIWRAGEST